MKQRDKKSQSKSSPDTPDPGSKEGKSSKLSLVKNEDKQRGPADDYPYPADQDSSSTVNLDSSSDIDEEEGEETTLNRSEIQEGPKGGKPQLGKGSPS